MEYRLRVECDPAWADAVCNRFFEVGLRGLEMASESPTAVILTYCDGAESAHGYSNAIESYLHELAAMWPAAQHFTIETESLEGVDWANEWKKYFKPVHVTERLVIRPSWEKYDAKRGERVLVIDPKMAFGTGGHETTTLALRALERFADRGLLNADTRVLDVGTGTGILAIAVVLMGARSALGVDIDPVAIECAQENAELNGTMNKTHFEVGGVALVNAEFPLVVANIDAPTLGGIAGDLAKRVLVGGRLLLTGLLDAGANEVELIFHQLGFHTLVREELGEWRLLELERDS